MTSSLELNTSAYVQQLATDQMKTDGSCAEPVTGALGLGLPRIKKTGGIVRAVHQPNDHHRFAAS